MPDFLPPCDVPSGIGEVRIGYALIDIEQHPHHACAYGLFLVAELLAAQLFTGVLGSGVTQFINANL